MSSFGYQMASESFDVEDNQTYRRSSRNVPDKPVWKNLIGGATVVGLSLAGVLLYNSKTNISVNKTSLDAESKMPTSITTVVTNEYTPLNQSKFAYSFLRDAVLMEPWRDNNVAIDGISSECSNSWKLVGKNALSEETFSGEIAADNSFVAIPKKTGFYTLHVNSDCGENTYEYEQAVVVKYVRREIFTLTERDREEFLDALRTLWDVSTEEGIKKYGPTYKSLYYFATVHNDGGGNPICDQFHRNSGFLHNHVYLGAYLEQSLQLVNPRTALHYWEYAQSFSSSDFQNHMTNQLDGGSWTDLMTAKYFGQSDPKTGTILDGRWAYTENPRLTPAFLEKHGIPLTKTFFPHEETKWLKFAPPHITSPYGFMRGPWNYSPSKYTLRYNNVMGMPSGLNMDPLTFKPFSGSVCSDYKNFIKNYVVGQPLINYLVYADAQVHGYTHYTVGGAGGDFAISVDKKLRDQFGFTDDDIAVVAIGTARFMKTWLSLFALPPIDATHPELGNVESPIICTSDPWDPATATVTTEAGPGEEGGPSCVLNDYYLEEESRTDKLMDDFFIDFTKHEYIHVRDVLYKNQTFETKKEVVRLIMSRMQIDGDMAGSGSATDPLFWMAHGAVERLYQRAVFEGVITDTSYAVVEGGGDYCQGHAADLTVQWLEGFYFEDKTVKAEEISNAELTIILDPTSEKYATHIPFVYDTAGFDFCSGFDKWWIPGEDDDYVAAAGGDNPTGFVDQFVDEWVDQRDGSKKDGSKKNSSSSTSRK